jgi:hypothetical protein
MIRGEQKMDEKRKAEVLAVYVEDLSGRPAASCGGPRRHTEAVRQIELTEEEREHLAPLFQLAERLQQSLRPVRPSPTFARSLGNELVNDARRQFALKKRTRRVMMIGAAAVGSLVSIVSVVGAIIFLMRRLRTQVQTQHAPTG